MVHDAIKKVLDDGLKLYALPQTLAEVLKVVSDESTGADDLAKVLMRDPAITARVLRVVNSPFYGVGRKIGSVSQAVVTIGMRQVTALALSTSVYSMTERWQSSFDRVRFWRHSLEVAIAARVLAEKIGYKKVEEMFVAGLLHDIGLLVLERSFADQYQKLWKQSLGNGSLVDLEEEAWGSNHARVGQFLLEQWQLPESICQAVGHHHTVFSPGAADAELIPSQIVNLANRISKFRIADRQAGVDPAERNNREIIRENLRLSVENLCAIEKQLFASTVEESKYLEIDIGSTEEILKEANLLLFQQYSAVETLLEENRRFQTQFAGEQVKTGFLESLKATTSAFTEYIDGITSAILLQVSEVEAGIKNGSIIDPRGLVAQSAKAITSEMQAVSAVMAEMKRLTRTESALYYDQKGVEAVENRIRSKLKSLDRPVGVA
ncbi:MAG: HDOD domain-containing protein [Candidatus Zixiibacteriota bacterium]